jgi:6-phosphogluconate dehydrogenase
MIGLGRMGANLVRRAMADGHHCVVCDRDASAVEVLVADGASGSIDVKAFVAAMPSPRTVWVMVPAGEVTESVVSELIELLEAGDCIIDGGNSYYRDDIRRGEAAAAKGIDYLDVGTSGGVWGKDRGYCLMIGGPDHAVSRLAPLWDTIAPGVDAAPRTPGRDGDPTQEERGWLHCGPVGAGHFVKMVHNGIDIPAIAEVWRRGSVVGSWLLDLTAMALVRSPGLDEFTGRVSDSGEGRWTAIAAIEEGVPTPVLTSALYERFESQGNGVFAGRVLSAMRKEFGGHDEKK